MAKQTILSVETMSIPTYPIMDCEKMPMFNENRNHQGTTGNPYPVMPVLSVVRENCQPKDYEVVRLENDYIRRLNPKFCVNSQRGENRAEFNVCGSGSIRLRLNPKFCVNSE